MLLLNFLNIPTIWECPPPKYFQNFFLVLFENVGFIEFYIFTLLAEFLDYCFPFHYLGAFYKTFLILFTHSILTISFKNIFRQFCSLYIQNKIQRMNLRFFRKAASNRKFIFSSWWRILGFLLKTTTQKIMRITTQAAF